MTRTDSFVVGTLVVLLALIAGLVGVPSLLPARHDRRPRRARAPARPSPRPYREGVLGPARLGQPVHRPQPGRPRPRRAGLLRASSGTARTGRSCRTSPSAGRSTRAARSGPSYLRDDARWQDGEPVTADDVAFTIRVLQDPAYTGPAPDRGTRSRSGPTGPGRSSSPWPRRSGGFLQAATQPIAPAHLLAGVPVAGLADAPFGHQPIGRGRSPSPASTTTRPSSIPAATVLDRSDASAAPGPTRPIRSPPPTATERARQRADPVPRRDRVHISTTTPTPSPRPIARVDLDAASGLSPALTRELASTPDSRALHYPGSTLTAVLLNLRAGHPEFADPAVRAALLAAIDRPSPGPRRLLDGRRAGDQSDPAVVRAVRPGRRSGRSRTTRSRPQVRSRRPAGRWPRTAGTCQRRRRRVDIELLSPDQASNPVAFETAEAVAHAWKAIGIGVHHVALEPGTFANDRLATGKFTAAVADLTVGLDPDLYPLLASSQTLHGRSNIIGLQDPTLDKLLVAARRPGAVADRKAAYRRPPGAARQGRLPAAAGLRGRVGRGPRHAHGTVRPRGRRPG